MSNFIRTTKHPKTGEMQSAEWLDDHFGRHRYGVRFPDGSVFRESEIEDAEDNAARGELHHPPPVEGLDEEAAHDA